MSWDKEVLCCGGDFASGSFFVSNNLPERRVKLKESLPLLQDGV